MKFSNIDEYHRAFPDSVQEKLEQLRKAINQAAPKATETISYGMPAFRQNKILVYYAGYKSHIGLYPTPNAIIAFREELTGFVTSKGTIQFPIDEPLPLALIKKIVKFRVKEDEQKTSSVLSKSESVHFNADILKYNKSQEKVDGAICNHLAQVITTILKKAECKIWHGHPVWFLDGNPIVGYSKQKQGMRLMFWSGADFEEPGLNVVGKKFKDASVFYQEVSAINAKDLKRWLKKSIEIQWDYKNIVKRKGKLVKL